MRQQLDNSVAAVTGASSGIGEATARALAAEGATVALIARRRQRLDELARAIEADGGKTLVVEADVTDHEQAGAAIERVISETGQLDTLVNNAGMGYMTAVADADPAEWRRMVDVNVLGVMYTTRAALPHLLRATDGERGFADVVTISSVAGRVARAGNGAYAATKHALGAFNESLREEVTGRHVRVCLIEPGMVLTELTEHRRSGGGEDSMSGIEWLDADDVAESVTFAVTRPRRMVVNELLVRPTEQER